eukprot:35394-Eustigmatos_ZCMA.PRE.1
MDDFDSHGRASALLTVRPSAPPLARPFEPQREAMTTAHQEGVLRFCVASVQPLSIRQCWCAFNAQYSRRGSHLPTPDPDMQQAYSLEYEAAPPA